jgi:hypothetical protein
MRNALITFMALTAAGLAQAAAQKLAPELRNLKAESRVDVIIQFRQTPTQANTGNFSHEADSSRTISILFGPPITPFPLKNSRRFPTTRISNSSLAIRLLRSPGIHSTPAIPITAGEPSAPTWRPTYLAWMVLASV